jgi:hypothetical protein
MEWSGLAFSASMRGMQPDGIPLVSGLPAKGAIKPGTFVQDLQYPPFPTRSMPALQKGKTSDRNDAFLVGF